MSPVFFEDKRKFYKCRNCFLIFTDEFAGEAEAEAHYKKQQAETDASFWKEQVDALLTISAKYVPRPKKILDFGAGSGEITKEIRSRGLDCTSLEPMEDGFLKDQSFGEKFDIIFAVEVIEHIQNLWEELREMEEVLSPGGVMVFSTILTDKFVYEANSVDVFREWFYKDDQTHVSFFCNETMSYIANMLGYEAYTFGQNVIVLKSR